MKYKIAREENYPWDNAMTNLLYEMNGSAEFLEEATAFKELISTKQILPCKHQIGDSVRLSFYGCGDIGNCKIIKIHFSEGSVLYDVEVSGNFDKLIDVVDLEDVKLNNKWHTRLYNIDSVFVIGE